MTNKAKWITFCDPSLSALLVTMAQEIDKQDGQTTILDVVTYHNDDIGEWVSTIYYDAEGYWE